MDFFKKHHITSFLIITSLIFGCFFHLTPEAFADNYAILVDDTSTVTHETPCALVSASNNDCDLHEVFLGSGNDAAIAFSLNRDGNDNRNFKISIDDDITQIAIDQVIPIQFGRECTNCSIEIDGAKSNGSKTRIIPQSSTPPASAFLVSEDIGNITIKNFDFQGFSGPAIVVQSIHNTTVEISANSFGQINPSTQPNHTGITITDGDRVLIRNNIFGRQTDNGLELKGSSSNNTIQENLFGVASVTDLANFIPGIQNDAINISEQSQNTQITDNIITNAGRNGISIIGGTGHEIGNNRIFNNQGLGVAIASRGNNQAQPAQLTSANRIGNTIKLSGTAESQSQITIYQANNTSSPAIIPDNLGGEGFEVLQSRFVDSSEDEDPQLGRFTFSLPSSNLILGDTLSAIKTLDHNSSGFSNNVVVSEKQAPSVTANSSPQSPQPGTLVTLTAVAIDPDSTANQLNFSWEQQTGPTVTLSSNSTVSPSFTTPTVATTTTLIFQVTVTDEAGLSDQAAVTVTVSPATPSNRSPIANAGIDQTTASSTQVQLNATGSTDPDGDSLTYQWSQATSDSYHVVLSSPTASRPQFISPPIAELQADLHFTLQVTDSQGAQNSDDVVVHVTRTKQAPVAIITVRSGTSFPAGTEITLDGGSSTFDPTTSVRQYRFRHIPSSTNDIPLTINQTNSSASLARVTLPSSISSSRDYSFELIVNDGTTDSVADTVLVQSTITQPTSTPSSTPTPTPSATPTCSVDLPNADAGNTITTTNTPGKIITLNGSASTDPHNLPITYYWRQMSTGPRVDIRNDQSPTPNFTIPTFSERSLTLSFQLTVTNSCNRTSTSIVRVSIGNSDADNDSLDSTEEDRLGTNPNQADTDSDDINDGVEVRSGCTSPTNPDSDNDGLRDGDEDLNHNGTTDGGETNPCLADTEHDEMPDGYETNNQLNPLDPRDANEDKDRDGLTNLEEFIFKTNPTIADTDSDGLNDGLEVKISHTSPIKDDTDGDGIVDGKEDTNHSGLVDPSESDPNRFDTDGDGLSDGLEIGLTTPQGKHTDPKKFQPDLDRLSKTNALAADTDGDRILDGNEDTNHNGSVDCGETNPLDPTNKVTLCKPVTTPKPTVTKEARLGSSTGISVKGSTTKTGGIVNLVAPTSSNTPRAINLSTPFSIQVSKGTGKQARTPLQISPLASISVLPGIMLPTTGPALSSILVYSPFFSLINK